jgi:hypothetical protein
VAFLGCNKCRNVYDHCLMNNVHANPFVILPYIENGRLERTHRFQASVMVYMKSSLFLVLMQQMFVVVC